jgi:hypothetical protein
VVGLDIEQIEGVKTPSIEPKGSCYFEDLLDNLHDSLMLRISYYTNLALINNTFLNY